MGLSGLQIFKLLPKTNCKDCGFPTCMAFALQVASGKAEASTCPHLAESTRTQLEEAIAAPVRKVVIGSGPAKLTLGEDTVLYRHERRFEHRAAVAVLLDDTLTEESFLAKMRDASSMRFERVGEFLRPQLLALRSRDGEWLSRHAVQAASYDHLALVLISDDPAVLRRGAAEVKDLRPLLHAASPGNMQEMAQLAAELDCPLVVTAGGLDGMAEVAAYCAKVGVRDLVLDPGSVTLHDAVRDQVFLRRAAIRDRVRDLGYPIMCLPGRYSSDPDVQTMCAAVLVARYASIVVVDDADPARVLPLLVLAQGLYTDPQRPMIVPEGVYPINGPGPQSPVLVTTNFSLTYYMVSGEIEASKVPTWLLVMDVEGQSVLTAWAAGKFVADAIATFVERSGIARRVDHRELVIPGYVSQIEEELQTELKDWKVRVGVREASDLPRYLRSGWETAR